jgi:uncharacterized linocin/CFP29 family protein
MLMDNLYRDLAPITDAAWAQIETEAHRRSPRGGRQRAGRPGESGS